MEVDDEKVSAFFRNFDLRNFSELINQMAKWINGYASGYKLVFFKNVKPASTEERIIADTGKILYLPAKSASLPQTDPFPQKRIITEEMFKLFLEKFKTAPSGVNDACARFIKAKYKSGIVSDAWVPVLFQEYVVGYIHIWLNDNEEKPPFSFKTIDMMYQFAKVVAYSLKINGFFEQGNMKNKPLEGNIIDISVSGILFAYPHARFASALLQGSKLAVKLISPRRTISSESTIVRCFSDNTLSYFGCQLDLAPEDIRFLFEFLYGRPFTDADMELYGQV
jgi:hypothetical protein